MVQAFGAEIILQVQPSLVPLFLAMRLPLTIVAKGDPLPQFDAHCPLMSLPLVFRTSLETVPAQIPYLIADSDRVMLWKQRLGITDRLRVGLVWSGSAAHKNDLNRSISLDQFLPLLDLPIEWHSLQTDYRVTDKVFLTLHPEIHQHQENFIETAALLECLDLIISVDTSLAHLAGALGKPVWILLMDVPDFRWLLDRADSPWYPSARLFRQDERKNWGRVLSEVKDALMKLIGRQAA